IKNLEHDAPRHHGGRLYRGNPAVPGSVVRFGVDTWVGRKHGGMFRSNLDGWDTGESASRAGLAQDADDTAGLVVLELRGYRSHVGRRQRRDQVAFRPGSYRGAARAARSGADSRRGAFACLARGGALLARFIGHDLDPSRCPPPAAAARLGRDVAHLSFGLMACGFTGAAVPGTPVVPGAAWPRHPRAGAARTGTAPRRTAALPRSARARPG